MNILALDYGSKRIGLAWVETTLGVVLPYGIAQQDGNDIPKDLLDIISEDKPERIVLGLPLSAKNVHEVTKNEERVRAVGTLL